MKWYTVVIEKNPFRFDPNGNRSLTAILFDSDGIIWQFSFRNCFDTQSMLVCVLLDQQIDSSELVILCLSAQNMKHHVKLSQWPAVLSKPSFFTVIGQIAALSLQCRVNSKSILIPPESELNVMLYFFFLFLLSEILRPLDTRVAQVHASRLHPNSFHDLYEKDEKKESTFFFLLLSFVPFVLLVGFFIHTRIFSLCVLCVFHALCSVHVFSGFNYTKIDW